MDKALIDTDIYEYMDKALHFLSHGQKKRVFIADILVMEPEVIIFDESTSSLDSKHSLEIVDIFNGINRNGTTVVISTHGVDLAYSWSDYIFVMKDGILEKQGAPYEIFSDDKLLESCYLQKPLILEVYEGMLSSGKIESHVKIPRNKKELLQIINLNK